MVIVCVCVCVCVCVVCVWMDVRMSRLVVDLWGLRCVWWLGGGMCVHVVRFV